MNNNAWGSFFCVGGLAGRGSVGAGEEYRDNEGTLVELLEGESRANFVGEGGAEAGSEPRRFGEGTLDGDLDTDERCRTETALIVTWPIDGVDCDAVGGFALGGPGRTRYVLPCTMGGMIRVVYRDFRSFTSFFAF